MTETLIERALEQGTVQAVVPGPVRATGRSDGIRAADAGASAGGEPRYRDFLLARQGTRRRWPPILVRLRPDGRFASAQTWDPDEDEYVDLSVQEAADLAGVSTDGADYLSDEAVDRRFEDLAAETLTDGDIDEQLRRMLGDDAGGS